MGTIARGTKSSGGTALTDGYDVLAAELNADFDTIFSEINGNLSSTNIAVGGITSASLASVDPAKVDDYSASATEMKVETNPDVSSSESLPITLEGELERIRYVLKRHAIGGLALHNAGGSNLSTYWGDYSVRGPNLVRNNSFEVKETADGAAPEGWTVVSIPSTLTVATTDASNGKGRCISIVGTDAGDGIKQIITGLKKSTHYFLQARYVVTAGSMIMSTNDADAASNFRNISITSTSATWATVSAIVKTDSTPTDITILFVSNAASDAFKIDDVTFREMDKEIVVSPKTITVYDSSTDATALSVGEAVFPGGDALTASVTVPCSGCTISVKACARAYASGTENITVILRQTIATGPASSDVDYASSFIENANMASVSLGYTNTNPTPGEKYTYSLHQLAFSTNGTANGVANGKTHKSWLEVTLHAPT